MISFDIKPTVEQEFEIQRALLAVRDASKEDVESLFKDLMTLHIMQKNLIRCLVMELAKVSL